MDVIIIRNAGDIDEAILTLLSQAGQPLCVSTISFLLNRPSRDVCMTLNRLRRYGEVRKATARPVQFWAAVKK
jgi:hypothetical protein